MHSKYKLNTFYFSLKQDGMGVVPINGIFTEKR